MELIKLAQKTLVVYENDDYINTFMDELKEKTCGVIISKSLLDVTDKLTSNFDLIISGFENKCGIKHSSSLLSTFLKVLKPNGNIVLRHISLPSVDITSQLKISGFVKLSKPTKINVSNEKIDFLKQKWSEEGEINIIEISCSKPNFEIGSSAKLSFAGKKDVSSAVWKIDGNDDDDAIDPDTLLDEDDLKKPDPESLRVCGTTGKRKACKDCSCGLAEELESDGEPKIDPVNVAKSSCGSCYLGDAFRCAACPYLGMPAFKPGEKIQLAGNQLQSDI